MYLSKKDILKMTFLIYWNLFYTLYTLLEAWNRYFLPKNRYLRSLSPLPQQTL